MYIKQIEFGIICNLEKQVLRQFSALERQFLEVDSFNFTDIVSDDCKAKAEEMFEKAMIKGFNGRTSILIKEETSEKMMNLICFKIDDKMLIIDSFNAEEIIPVLDDLVKINNENINKLRSLIKSGQNPGLYNDPQIYQEFTKINNELSSMQRELSKKNNQLNNQKDRLKLINKILRHDLTNIFSAILSGARLFEKTGNEQFLEEIKVRAFRGVDLIQSMKMLEMVDGEKIELKNISLEMVIDDLKKEFPDLQINIPENVSLIANEGIDSIFKNLVQNAYNHGESKHVILDCSLENGYAVFALNDDGLGIPEAIKPMIFDENFKHGKHSQTGLGLYIVKRLIENYRGYIEVSDSSMGGACFRFKIPVDEG